LREPSLRKLALLCWLALAPLSTAAAQQLPRGATPRGVLFAFLNETASTSDSIDRAAFRDRLVGEFASSDPKSLRALLPAGSKFRIDTIPTLSHPENDFSRVAAYVTVERGSERENWYLFCVGDSVWRIEALRRFPSQAQRAQIKESIKEIDTATPAYRLLRADLQRVLLPDDSLGAILARNLPDAEKVAEPLRQGKLWQDFSLRDVDFGKLEEYRELDDDIDEGEVIFYTLDRAALERLKRTIGLRRIERDPDHPGLLFFVTGQIEKSTVGYINCTDPTLLPGISRNGFITLKPVGEGWWLYKRMR
jgi:hypothetical protein